MSDKRSSGWSIRLNSWLVPALVVVAAEPSRTAARYGPRADRYATFEAGAAAQGYHAHAGALVGETEREGHHRLPGQGRARCGETCIGVIAELPTRVRNGSDAKIVSGWLAARGLGWLAKRGCLTAARCPFIHMITIIM
mgnify:CR=1 FL=1